MESFKYTVVVEPNDDEPGYTVSVPALPGCISAGETVAEALDNVRDAIELWLKIAYKKGETPPVDRIIVSKVVVAA